MAREIEEWWVAQAIERHRRLEQLRDQLEIGLRSATLSVHSPDDRVRVRVRADGSVDQVTLPGPVEGHSSRELSGAIDTAISGAADAARWARLVLYRDLLAARAAEVP